MVRQQLSSYASLQTRDLKHDAAVVFNIPVHATNCLRLSLGKIGDWILETSNLQPAKPERIINAQKKTQKTAKLYV